MLVDLLPVPGNVFSVHALFGPYGVVIGVQENTFARWGVQLHISGELGVVGETADECVAAAADRFVIAKSMVFPHRDRAGDKFSEGRISGFYADFIGAAHLFPSLIPVGIELAGVVAHVAFAQAVIGGLPGRRSVGKMLAGIPGVVGEYPHTVAFSLEKQAGHPAAHVAEPVASKIPYQNRNDVLAGFEIRSYVHRVVITVAGSRASLESALVHGHLSVDPHPVFGIRRYPCRKR